ncbi:hypothetical protein ABFY57_11985 [Paenibacillus polymyxa]|uniref:hypothetical protein n=1 Tax=Paenibacillus polymyxa TaxID=1406 RepID=UPI003D2E0D9D
MVIVYLVELTDEQKNAVRDAIMDLDDDEFVILHDNQAIYGEKTRGKVVIREILKFM